MATLSAQPDQCLSFDCGSMTELMELGYFFHVEQGEIRLDSHRVYDDTASLYLRQEVDGEKMAVYTRQLPTHLFAGHQVELRARIKQIRPAGVKAGAAIMLAAYDSNGQTLAFMNSTDQVDSLGEDWSSHTVSVFIPEETDRITIGGFVGGRAEAWFDAMELYIDGKRFVTQQPIPPPTAMLPARPEVEWLRQYVRPLRVDDLHPFGEAIGESTLVGLGESTHGSREIFMLKAALFAYLQREKGFGSFAMESDPVDAQQIDRYIRGEPLDTVALVQALGSRPWQTEEVLDMLVGMRKRYRGGEATFVGIDNQFFRPAYEELRTVFGEEHPEEFDDLYNTLGIIHGDSAEPKPSHIRKVTDALNTLSDAIVGGNFSPVRTDWLRHMVRQLAMRLHGSTADRDAHLAENALWWQKRVGGGKLAIWAHNEHIKTVSPWMGSHLRAALDDDYVAVGFTFFEGSYSAGSGSAMSEVSAQRAYPGTYEAVFSQLGEAPFFIDLREITRDTSPYAAWFTQPLGFRRVGIRQPSEEFGRENLTQAYDLMIFLCQSSPTRMLRIAY